MWETSEGILPTCCVVYENICIVEHLTKSLSVPETLETAFIVQPKIMNKFLSSITIESPGA